MSDAAITAIVAGFVNIATLLAAFLTLWLKLKYSEKKAEELAIKTDSIESKTDTVEQKIDENTHITVQAREATHRFREHTEACDDRLTKLNKVLSDHDSRIIALEAQMVALRLSMETIDRNVNSTRHEMRGHLQSIVNKMDLMVTTGTASKILQQPDK